ncbi:MAG: metallophosphoesterase [Pseudomonadota bacterium]
MDRLRVFGSLLTLTVATATAAHPSSEGAHGGHARVEIDDPHHHLDAKPWTSLDVLDGPERFQFLVVTDRTGGARAGVFAQAAQKIDLLQPAFVMSVGDFIEGYTDDEAVLHEQWNAFDAIVDRIDAPFFYTPGNHDWQNRAMAQVWTERLGKSFYHFRYKDTLFIVLNSELFDRRHAPWWRREWTQLFAAEQAEQLTYLERVLGTHQDVRWTFVFVHKPYWRQRWAHPPKGESSPAEGPWPKHNYRPPEWIEVEAMLDDRNYTIFAGHLHTYEFDDSSSDAEHTHEKIALATTGGVSALRGVEYGEFDHMVWVTMTRDGPVIANLLQHGILPKVFPMAKQRPYWVD